MYLQQSLSPIQQLMKRPKNEHTYQMWNVKNKLLPLDRDEAQALI